MAHAKPTVAIIHFSAPPVVGGVEKVIDAQARLFVDNGYRCKLVVARGEASDKRVELCRVERFDSRHPLNERLSGPVKEGKRPPEFDGYRDAILGDLRSVLADADVVLVHNALVKDLNFAFVEAFRLYAEEASRRKVLVNWCHDPTCSAYNADESIATSQAFPWRLINNPIPGVINVTLCKTRRRQLAEVYRVRPEEILVIPDGVDVPTFLGICPEIVALWLEFDLIAKDLVLFTPTRVVPKKNIQLGVQVVKALRDLGTDAALLVSGPPSQHVAHPHRTAYYEQMKRLAGELDVQDGVVFLHEVALDDGSLLRLTDRMIRQLYFLSDMLFYPSLEEGFGLPLLEAALTKTIVVCSRIDALVELGREDVLYIEPDDSPEACAAKILDRLHRSTRVRLFKRAVREFDWRAVFADQIEPLVLAQWRRVQRDAGAQPSRGRPPSTALESEAQELE